EKQDDAQVKEILEKLEKEAHRLAGSMYGSANGGPGGPEAGGANGGAAAGPTGGGEKKGKDGGVIDAEFEETSN
ncbi:MAG: molecular chaperone DnaK, partial [Deltaproteobacteria bacterium]|nr:molecular chaperone DnaK [Deltaproteobacteria bacterium]